jgi:arylsulfatase A-like enzyme
MKHLLFLLLLTLAITPCAHTQSAIPNPKSEIPNILWFVVDDMSPHFSCYGETTIATPNIDRLAAEGTRFTRAYVTAPVCSTCRSALITGLYQTTIGAHHHRSGRGDLKIHLPEGVTPVPALFQKAGYFTCIGSGLPGKDHAGQDLASRKNKKGKSNQAPFGKTDYNFEWDPAIYNSPDWADHGDKPFFMQVQLHGGKLREGPMAKRAAYRQRVIATFGNATDPEKVTLPPYYPRDPVLLQDWADYLDAVRLTDHHVGQVIARLEKENLLENTLIIFMTDHGISHARGKQFLYNEGTHVPFIVRGPGIAKGTVRDDLIEQIDLAPTSLAAAHLPIPPAIQGRNLFAKDYTPRTEVFAARDRCDETTENLRSIRTDRFLYIRNGHPQRPHLQPNAYKDAKPILIALRAAHTAGTLPSVSEDLLFSPTRAPEELYDTLQDPHQVTNLATNPTFKDTLEKHRQLLDAKLTATRDPAPETPAQYDSDMAEYLKKKDPIVEANIALMKKWAAEGK